MGSIEYDEPREFVLFLSQLWHADALPKVSSKLNQHKQFVVQALMDFLVTESADAEPVDTVKDCITALNNMGIYWPDLSIIKKSLSKSNNGDQHG